MGKRGNIYKPFFICLVCIINNANVQLQAIKHMDEYGYNNNHAMPALLTGNTDDSKN